MVSVTFVVTLQAKNVICICKIYIYISRIVGIAPPQKKNFIEKFGIVRKLCVLVEFGQIS